MWSVTDGAARNLQGKKQYFNKLLTYKISFLIIEQLKINKYVLCNIRYSNVKLQHCPNGQMKCQWDKFSAVLIKKWKVKSHVAATLKSCTKLPSIDMKSSQHTPRKWTLIFNFLFTFCLSSIHSWFIMLLFLLHSGFKLWVVFYFFLYFEAKIHIFLTLMVL